MGLDGDAPDGRPVTRGPSQTAKVVSLSRVGGLHHRYEWRDAACGTRLVEPDADAVRMELVGGEDQRIVLERIARHFAVPVDQRSLRPGRVSRRSRDSDRALRTSGQ